MFIEQLKENIYVKDFTRKGRESNKGIFYEKRHYITKKYFLSRVFNLRCIRDHSYSFTNLLHFIK